MLIKIAYYNESFTIAKAAVSYNFSIPSPMTLTNDNRVEMRVNGVFF